MGSLRFPFSFSHLPPRTNPTSPSPLPVAVAVAAAAVGIGMSIAISTKSNPFLQNPWGRSSPAWAAMSLSEAPSGPGTSVDPKIGAAFPTVIDGTKLLLGIGLRRKSVFGLKNIDVYAFGVYADVNDVKKSSEKYGTMPISDWKDKKDFYGDILDEDIRMMVRLQIVYGRLSIRSVRNAFEESVGSRLQKFSQTDNKELLQRFTSFFKDEYKIPKGTQIDLTREHGYTLQTKIDGKEVGSIKSKLLCKSIFDLYIGDEPFDARAKEEIQLGLASLLQE